MSSAERQKLLSVLAELSEVCPDARFGQLIANLSYRARDVSHEAIGVVEDEELLAAAESQLQEFKSLQASKS